MKCCPLYTLSRAFAAFALLSSLAVPAAAQSFSIFNIGGTNLAFTDDDGLADFYWENGDYTGFGRQNWRDGREPFELKSGTLGFPRSLNNDLESIEIYFQLDAAEADPAAVLTFRALVDSVREELGMPSTHDIEVLLNGNRISFDPAFASSRGIINATVTAGEAGAIVGANQLIIRRTAFTTPWPQVGEDAPDNPGYAFIEFRSVTLAADLTAIACDDSLCYFKTESPRYQRGSDPVTLEWKASPGETVTITPGVGELTSDPTTGLGSVEVSPDADTTYTISTSGGASRTLDIELALVTNFEVDERISSEGAAQLSWSSDADAAISLDNEIGEVETGIDSLSVFPTSPTTYTLTATLDGRTETASTFVAPTAIFGFSTVGDRPTSLDWSTNPLADLEITPDIGDVTPITADGFGTITVSPSETTTYTLTATLGEQISRRSITVSPGSRTPVWSIGQDNGSQREFEQEFEGMEDFYLTQGDFRPLGGVNWTTAPETLNDGIAGDPGFPRALSVRFPEFRIFFTLTAEDIASEAPFELVTDLRSPRDFLSQLSTHEITAAVNGTVIGTIGGLTTGEIAFPFSAADAGLEAGINVLTLSRTGEPVPWPIDGGLGSPFDPEASFIQFDTLSLNTVGPFTPERFLITGVEPSPTDSDAIIITWNAEIGQTYSIQISEDLVTWETIESNFRVLFSPATYTLPPPADVDVPAVRYIRVIR